MSLVTSENYFFAGLLVFAGHDLTEIQWDDDNRKATYLFDMAVEEFEELHTAFESEDGQPVACIRRYGEALKFVDGKTKRARNSDLKLWARPVG